MGAKKIEPRDVIVTAVGMALDLAILGFVLPAAYGTDEARPGYVFAGNLGVGLCCLGITGLSGFYERDVAIWRYGRAWAFGLVGAWFLLGALMSPAATRWLFASSLM